MLSSFWIHSLTVEGTIFLTGAHDFYSKVKQEKYLVTFITNHDDLTFNLQSS